jgi:hypothetical protein
MENIKRNLTGTNTENTHKSRCIECQSYNECMGVWLDYFAGKRNIE